MIRLPVSVGAEGLPGLFRTRPDLVAALVKLYNPGRHHFRDGMAFREFINRVVILGMKRRYNGHSHLFPLVRRVFAEQRWAVEMEYGRIFPCDRCRKLPVERRNRAGVAGKRNPHGPGREELIGKTSSLQVVAFHFGAYHDRVHMLRVVMNGFRHPVDHRKIVVNKLDGTDHPGFVHAVSPFRLRLD